MVDNGLDLRINRHGVIIKDENNMSYVIVKAIRVGRFLKMITGIPSQKALMAHQNNFKIFNSTVWHKRYGHLNYKSLINLGR